MENVKKGDKVFCVLENNEFVNQGEMYEVVETYPEHIEVKVDDKTFVFLKTRFENKYYKPTNIIPPANKTDFHLGLDIEITKELENLTKGNRYNVLEIRNHAVFVKNDNGEIKAYNSKSFTKVIKKCEDCSDIFESDDDIILNVNGEEICQSCREENYFVCNECEEVHHNDSEIYIESEEISVCEGCRDNKFTECQDCGDLERNNNMTWVHNTDNGVRVCKTCKENNYFYCNSCDEYKHTDLYGENDWCQNCIDTEESREINDYCYSPRFKPEGKMPLYFGVEIEVERKNADMNRDELAGSIKSDRIYCKNDGSLSNGFEIVTQPFNLALNSETMGDLKNAVETCSKEGYKSHEASTCGFHIHASKAAMTENQISLLHEFFTSERNDKFIELIARRNYGSYTERNYKMLMKAKKGKKNFNQGKYVAFNTSNDDTVEFRIYKGSLKWSTVNATLHFTKHLIDFCGKCSVQESRDFRHFLKYLKKVDKNRIVRDYMMERLERKNLQLSDLMKKAV